MIHPPIYGAGPFADYGDFRTRPGHHDQSLRGEGAADFSGDRGRACPRSSSEWCPGWGTTAEDRRALEQLANVRILPNARNIDDVLARTRVLLMPSLWYEGFGLIVMEAMLRGIPVVSSDSGGLVEAKHGTGYVIPVHTIERYEPVFDEHAMPRPVVRENDVAPWVAALRELLGDRAAYQRESRSLPRRRRALRRGAGCGGHGALPRVAARRAPGGPRRTPPSNRSPPKNAPCCWSVCASGRRRNDGAWIKGKLKHAPRDAHSAGALSAHGGGEALAREGVCRVSADLVCAQWRALSGSLAERGGAASIESLPRKTRSCCWRACASEGDGMTAAIKGIATCPRRL